MLCCDDCRSLRASRDSANSSIADDAHAQCLADELYGGGGHVAGVGQQQQQQEATPRPKRWSLSPVQHSVEVDDAETVREPDGGELVQHSVEVDDAETVREPDGGEPVRHAATAVTSLQLIMMYMMYNVLHSFIALLIILAYIYMRIVQSIF